MEFDWQVPFLVVYVHVNTDAIPNGALVIIIAYLFVDRGQSAVYVYAVKVGDGGDVIRSLMWGGR